MRTSICARMASSNVMTAIASTVISVSITSVSPLRLPSTRSNTCIM